MLETVETVLHNCQLFYVVGDNDRGQELFLKLQL